MSYFNKALIENPLDDPILASTYIKFSPVPEEWKQVLVEYKEWETNKEENGIFLHEKINLLNTASEVLVNGLEKDLGVKIDDEFTFSQSSIIYQILITLPLIELISNEALKLIEQTYVAYQRNKEIDPVLIAKSLSTFSGEIVALRRPIRKIGEAINTFARAYISDSSKVTPPHVRTGIVGSFIRFETSFKKATSTNSSWEARADFMLKTVKQAQILLTYPENKKIQKNFFMVVALNLSKIPKEALESDVSQKDHQDYNTHLNKTRNLVDAYRTKLNSEEEKSI